MVSVGDLFEASGPVHLTSVNWNCPHHQRSTAACLVQGAYVLERDRQQNRQGSEARAPAWWEFFHFKPIHQLVDDDDYSIFGAIYQFNPPVSAQNPTSASAPRFVIAFRGTIPEKMSLTQDLALDLRLVSQRLHLTSRLAIAMQAVRNLVSAVGTQKIWLTGHSLGSAMATLAGKNMVKDGVYLEAFLFNPPFFAAPIEKIKYKRVREGIRIVGSLITAVLAKTVKGHCKKSEECFADLSLWVPNLFVNQADPICSEYVGYFEQRRKMEEIGAREIGRLATQNSIRDILMNAFGKDSEPLHLLPSVNLTVNSSPSPDFKMAHGKMKSDIEMEDPDRPSWLQGLLAAHQLEQWWNPELKLEPAVTYSI